MAFDADGRRLKKDNYTGIDGSQKKVYFWGLPTKFVIDVATQQINKSIDFDIQRRPVDPASYTKFKEDIDVNRAIEIITWTIECFTNKEMQRIKKLALEEIDMDEMLEELDIYMEMLKKMYYK